MKTSSKNSIKSLVSLILILSSLFSIAFLQMEELRQGYSIMHLNKELKKKIESRRSLEIKRLTALRPQKIEKEIQSRTAFNQAQSDQIIHMPSPSLNPYSSREPITERNTEAFFSRNRKSETRL